nr:hypothetical protein [Tanacetum cinerariifolium]
MTNHLPLHELSLDRIEHIEDKIEGLGQGHQKLVCQLHHLSCYHSDNDENKKDGRCDEEKIQAQVGESLIKEGSN